MLDFVPKIWYKDIAFYFKKMYKKIWRDFIMKKFLCLMLALSMFGVLFAGCTKEATPATPESAVTDEAEVVDEAVASDLAYVKEKGTLVVGITDFAPMDYQDETGAWIGFDADMAKAFAEDLGVAVEFQVIDWDNKVLELDSKNIDDSDRIRQRLQFHLVKVLSGLILVVFYFLDGEQSVRRVFGGCFNHIHHQRAETPTHTFWCCHFLTS